MSSPHACGVRVLVLSNGVTSAERQCYGLLRALWPDADGASHAQLLRVTHQSFPAAALLRRLPAAVHVLAGSRFAGVDVAALAAQADDALQRDGLLSLVVACGRDTVPAAAALRAASPRAVVAVQLLHPRVSLSAFDLCVVPAHDAVAVDDEECVHRTLGVLHDFDAASLAAARARWAHALASSPRPLVACLVGAPTANCPFDGAALARDVAALAADVERGGGCLRCALACLRAAHARPALTHPFLLSICPSRRTPPGLLSALRWAVMGVRCASLVPMSGDGNCYAGLLAWSDVLVVTADSISMVSEASSTARVVICVRSLLSAENAPRPRHLQGASVKLLAAHHARGKLRRFLDALVASGTAQPWTSGAALSEITRQCGQQGLQEAAAAAAAVRRALDARRAALGLAL